MLHLKQERRSHCLWAFGCDMLSTKDVQWRQWRWTWYIYNKKISPNQLVRRREMSKSFQRRRWHCIEGSDRTRSPIRPHYSIYLPIVQIGSRRQWQWHTGFDIWKIALEEVNAIKRLSRLLQNAGNNKQLVYSYCWAETLLRYGYGVESGEGVVTDGEAGDYQIGRWIRWRVRCGQIGIKV